MQDKRRLHRRGASSSSASGSALRTGAEFAREIFRQSSGGYLARLLRYATRKVRGWALQVFLYIWLAALFVESWWHPIPEHAGTRVLVIVIGGMGDCLLFEPVLRRIREAWPDARIDVLSVGYDEMWRRVQCVDNVIYFRNSTHRRPWRHAEFFRCIYRNRYDVAIEALAMLPSVGTWHLLSALVLDATRASIRVGRPGTGKLFLWLGNPDRLAERERWRGHGRRPRRRPRNRHVTRFIQVPEDTLILFDPPTVLEAIGLPSERRGNQAVLLDDPTLDHWANALLRERWATPYDLIVGVVLEVTYELKRWPVDRFAELIRRGIADGLRFVVVGCRTQNSKLLSTFPTDRLMDLTGITSLGQLLSVVRECDFFIGSDSGPVHIAQAYRVPTIVLFGPSKDQKYGPADKSLHSLVTPRADLPCRPCGLGPCVMERSCMHLISVDEVYDQLRRKIVAFSGDSRPTRARREPHNLRAKELRVLCDV